MGDMTQIKEQIRSRLPAMQSPDEPEGAVASWITSTLLPQTVQTAQELQADVDRAEQNVRIARLSFGLLRKRSHIGKVFCRRMSLINFSALPWNIVCIKMKWTHA